MTDLESELRGQTRMNSLCPSKSINQNVLRIVLIKMVMWYLVVIKLYKIIKKKSKMLNLLI